MKVPLALWFVIINVVSAVNITEEIVDLCSNSSNYGSYTKNITQNCGCENTRACFRKCCQKGFYLQYYEDPNEDIYQSVCVKNISNSFNVPIYSGHENTFNLTLDDTFMVGMLNCGNERWQYFKMNNSDKREKFYIQENGSLYYPYSKYKFYNNSRYCVDEQDGLSVFLCYSLENTNRSSRDLMSIINSIGMIISMPFLLLTFLVYAVASNASVHRRSLMCYSLSLFLACVFLVTVQLHTKVFKPLACQTIGYSIIYFFMASFFWMNIMCFDIWCAFGGLIKFSREPKSERSRFIGYCAYAWGLPFIHICIVFSLNTYGNPNSRYYPGVGRIKCFLGESLPTFIYFYGPLTVIIGVNIVLFLLTSTKLHKIQKTTFSFHLWCTKRNSYEYDKRKFHLYLKLLLATGINWSLEIISWAIQLQQEQREEKPKMFFIWYISDFCNAIYGVIIFILFVYKKAVWKSFKKRCYVLVKGVVPCSIKSYEVEELERSQQQVGSRTTSISTDRDISFKRS